MDWHGKEPLRQGLTVAVEVESPIHPAVEHTFQNPIHGVKLWQQIPHDARRLPVPKPLPYFFFSHLLNEQRPM